MAPPIATGKALDACRGGRYAPPRVNGHQCGRYWFLLDNGRGCLRADPRARLLGRLDLSPGKLQTLRIPQEACRLRTQSPAILAGKPDRSHTDEANPQLAQLPR